MHDVVLCFLGRRFPHWAGALQRPLLKRTPCDCNQGHYSVPLCLCGEFFGPDLHYRWVATQHVGCITTHHSSNWLHFTLNRWVVIRPAYRDFEKVPRHPFIAVHVNEYRPRQAAHCNAHQVNAGITCVRLRCANRTYTDWTRPSGEIETNAHLNSLSTPHFYQKYWLHMVSISSPFM